MIAFDSSVQNAGANWSHTCTGTNLGLFVWGIAAGGPPTGVLYGSQSMTLVTTVGDYFLYFLANPAPGTHTIALQGALGANCSISVSYTGMNVSLDSIASAVTHSTGTVTPSTNVVALNCWLLGFAYDSGAQAFPITTPSTLRQEIAEPGSSGQERIALADSNGTVGTGAQSITFNDAGISNPFTALAISIAPFVAFVNPSDNLFEAGN